MALKFGPWSIAETEVFYASQLSFGLVNTKPIVPGHVLLITKRVAARFSDLTADEVNDLFASAQRVAGVIESHFEAQSMTITIQDGPAAGQTVPHVHIHVIPRRVGDWANNDDIYPEIDESEAQMAVMKAGDEAISKLRSKKKGPDAEERVARTQQQMAEEALMLRKYFPDNCVPFNLEQ